jgi:hypothetical protein
LLISCAEDMALYLIAHLNGGRGGGAPVLSCAGMAALHRGAVDFNFMGQTLGQYAMGWFIGALGPQPLVWHSGTLPDFAAYMALLPGQTRGVVLLFNADHHWMNPVLTEVGTGVTALLAGQEPPPSPLPTPLPLVDLIPWLLRGQLLLPACQLMGAAATLRRLRRWRRDPALRPHGARRWGLHLLLPLIANLLAALTLLPLLGKQRGYLLLYMPDSARLALVCGSWAAVWGLLRTGLVLAALGKRPPPSSPVHPQEANG